jgi:hypothetical protein
MGESPWTLITRSRRNILCPPPCTIFKTLRPEFFIFLKINKLLTKYDEFVGAIAQTKGHALKASGLKIYVRLREILYNSCVQIHHYITLQAARWRRIGQTVGFTSEK